MAKDKVLDNLLEGVEVIEEPTQDSALEDVETIPEVAPEQPVATEEPVELEPLEKALVAASPVLKPVGKVMDYLAGVARTTAAAPFSEKVELADIGSALAANPPSGDEILERFGMEEQGKLSDVFPSLFNETGKGIKLQKGGPLDVTGRGTAGTALEMVFDPLTYSPLVAKHLGKFFTGTGKALHAGPLTKIDRSLELAGKGKQAYSSELLKRGIAGSAEEIEQQIAKRLQELRLRQDAVLEHLSQKGARVELGNELAAIKNEIGSIKADPLTPVELVTQANQLEKNIDKFMIGGSSRPEQVVTKVTESPILTEKGVPYTKTEDIVIPAKEAATIKQASGLKSDLYNLLDDESYNILSRSSTGGKLTKDTARALKESIEASAQATDATLANELSDILKQQEIYLTGQKPLARRVTSEVTKPNVSGSDVVLGTLAPQAAIMKKGLEIGMLPATRTRAGLALNRAGQAIEDVASKIPAKGIAATRAAASQLQRQAEEPLLPELKEPQFRVIAQQDKIQKIVNNPEVLKDMKFKTQNPKLRNLISKIESGNPTLRNSALYLIKSTPELKQELEMLSPSDEDLDFQEQLKIIRGQKKQE